MLYFAMNTLHQSFSELSNIPFTDLEKLASYHNLMMEKLNKNVK